MPSFARAWASAESTTPSEYTVTQSFWKKPPKSLKLGKCQSKKIFPGFTEDSSEQTTLSASQSGNCVQKSTGCCPPSTLGGPHCSQTADSRHDSRPNICRTLARATSAGATGHCNRDGHRHLPLTPLDNSEKPTARLYLQKAAKAADDSRQQTIQGYNGPTIKNPPVPEIEQSGLASQQRWHDDSELTFGPHRKSRLSALPAPSAALPSVLTVPDCDA